MKDDNKAREAEARAAFMIMFVIIAGIVLLIGLAITWNYINAKINIMEFTGRVDAVARHVKPDDIATIIKELKK